MSIFPLPVFEEDADPAKRDAISDEERYAKLESPSTIVVRVGSMRRVAEYPYSGDAKPGCGSKMVARTHRGTELVEMLTTTCPNSGCGKAVTRAEMLDYIKASGGKDYPFRTDGQILRVATIEDLNQWSALKSLTLEKVKFVRGLIEEHALDMKVVDVEPILGEEQLTIYYMSEDRVDFRVLLKSLATEFSARIEMRQVGGRDEARLVADYEKCGQHCCCKNFLKVLKPVSMRSAKVQKATLDPLKISGRCGRLMCCLRYEDQTYDDLKKRLPHRKTRVGTPEGPGIVLDSKILVQLVLVQLEEDGREIAVPVEELCDPDNCPTKPVEPDPFRGLGRPEVEERTNDKTRKRGQRKSQEARQAEHKIDSQAEAASQAPSIGDAPTETEEDPDRTRKKRRRRRRRKSGGDAGDSGGAATTDSAAGGAEDRSDAGPSPQNDAAPRSGDGGGAPKKKRRRRRRKGGGGNDGSEGGGGSGVE
ncbi:MAG: regulatory iron-sulfur-containing complex subunit RicT [Phycisphaerales bacterium]|nr:regulatory iron-sulfur-containing complex subunit RicT [Phycisphaerales bacterium]